IAGVICLGLPPTRVAAAPPEGLTIGQSATCVVRSGGFEGFRLEYQFEWFYPATASLGAHLTIGGTYSIQIHNPESGGYETLLSYPYGFFLEPERGEKRLDRLSPREARWAFDQIRLETTWR